VQEPISERGASWQSQLLGESIKEPFENAL